jgi:hydroxymethylbilane synthase
VLRLGTRGSRLALCQAGLAADALREAGLGPVAIVPISTIGDRDRRHSFSELGSRGVFSTELEQALVADQIDVAVHSAKDLTTDDPPGLTLAAVLPRADARDAWCGPQGSLAAVPEGARIGTASTRRTAQLGAIRPDLVIEGLRGNVDTRLRKRGERGLAAIILAACGLDRLALSDEIGFRVSPDVMLPEVGQGFIALQTRAADAAALAAVNDPEGLRILRTERAAAATFGGGCLAPVAAHAESLEAGRIRLRVWIGRPDGSGHAEASGEGDDPESLGRAVADEVLAAGGRLLLDEARA